MKLTVLIGTRPGIIKMAPIYHAAQEAGSNVSLIHSGQHYSSVMDEKIMNDVELPVPDYRYIRPENCISHAEQTAFMMINIEKALSEIKPNLFFVCGDANTNFAGAVACRKLGIQLAHVEAGLRSFDWRMPEEHNRVMIDHISDLLFAPTSECVQHLKKENVSGKIFCVGNTVADSALRFSPKKIDKKNKALITLHREENVDDPNMLKFLLEEISKIVSSSNVTADFLLHPRTLKMMKKHNIHDILTKSINIVEPVTYKDMLRNIAESDFILTDSGGLQEEACILGTPCYTLRKTTERPETVDCGANVILGVNKPFEIFCDNYPMKKKNWNSPFGDGKTAQKIINHSINHLSGK